MFFYNVAPKYPIVGFTCTDYEINIQTPQSDTFRITLTADNKVHSISDVYAGDKAKQDAALAHCIAFLCAKLKQRAESVDLSEMIANLEAVKELAIASQNVETARSQKLRKLTDGKRAKDEQRKSRNDT